MCCPRMFANDSVDSDHSWYKNIHAINANSRGYYTFRKLYKLLKINRFD
jgi:hypothetical protein